MDDTPLNRLIHRLEAATSRLEDIASSSLPHDATTPDGHHADATENSALLAASQNQRSQQTSSGSTPGASQTQLQEPLPHSIEDFDTLLHGDLKAYYDLSQSLDGLIAEQVCYLEI